MLVFLSLVAVAFGAASTSTVATGQVDWNAASTWSVAGGIPTGSGVGATTSVTVSGDVQVVVSSTVNLASAATLTLGALGQAGTQLIVNGTSFTVLYLTWTNGWIVGKAGGSFAVFSTASLGGGSGSQDRQLVGGTFSLTAPLGAGSVSINAGSLSVNGSTVDGQGGSFKIANGAWLNFSAASVSVTSSAVTFQGQGSASGSVSIQGELQNSATIDFGYAGLLGQGASSSNTWVSGNFTLTGSGQANINDGSALVVTAGGRLQRASATAAAKINVAATATVEFAAGTTSWLDASISSSGKIVVDAGATTTVSASSTISGSGSLNISGTLIANAALNLGADASGSGSAAYTTTVYAGGELQIGAGVTATLGKLTFNNNSSWRLAFSGSSFTQVTTGDLALAGTLYVTVPSQPSASVTLVVATSITGFASTNIVVTAGVNGGRRLLASGSVQQNGNNLTYTPPPGGDSSAATKAHYLVALPLLALLW